MSASPDNAAPSDSPTLPETDLLPSAPIAETEGSLIGRYKLLQVIGEGGFGVVYMAEQTEPVIRRVALKIIKLGITRGALTRGALSTMAGAKSNFLSMIATFLVWNQVAALYGAVILLAANEPWTHWNWLGLPSLCILFACTYRRVRRFEDTVSRWVSFVFTRLGV
jgi:hypothetical protein